VGSDGTAYAADFSLTVKGAPATIKGTMTLSAAGAGSALAVNGTATVPIPMFGAKLEAVISEQIGAILSVEGDYTRSRLA
jgi:hypothetical protein